MALRNLIEIYSHTVGERTDIDKIMTPPLLLQRFLGHQLLDPNWSWRRFYHYQLFMVALLTYIIFGTLNVIRQPDVELDLLAQGYFTLMMFLFVPFKLILFINNRYIFRDLYVTVKTKLFELIRANSSVSVEYALKKSLYPLFSMMVIPFFAYEFVTVWHYVRGNRKWLSPASDTLLPMTTPYFEVTWLLHSVFFLELSSVIVVIDVWFVFFMTFFGLASDCIADILKVENRNEEETRADYGIRLNKVLKEFYENHVKLIKYLEKLGEMYKWLALIPLVNAAALLCVLSLVLSAELNLKFATNIMPVLANAFVYSWFGEQVKEKMHTIEMALLNFDWTNMNPKDRKSYYNIVSYMQREFGIKTAIGHDLSMITMTNVLKSSYQAFTVLQTLN